MQLFAGRGTGGGGDDERRARRQARLRRAGRAVARGTLLLTAALAVRWQFAARGPVYPTPAREDRQRTAPLSGPNAAHFYAAAVDALPERLSDFDPDRATPAEMRSAVADASASLALLREGFGYRYQGLRTRWLKGPLPEGLSAPVPNYVAVRTLARLLIADARLKGAAGDHAGALDSSLQAVRFGQELARGGDSLIEGMVGALVQDLGGREALKHVAGLSGAEARAALRRVEALGAGAVPFAHLAETERRSGYAILRELFGPGGDRAVLGAELNAGDLGSRLALTGLVLWYGKQGTVGAYTAVADEAVRRAALPYQEAKSLGDPPRSRNWVVSVMVPNMARAHGRVARAETYRRLLLARLALRAYAAEHGGAAPPRTLDALTRGPEAYLQAVPADPLSPDGVAPLRYRAGRVWSVGQNGDDEGGAGDDGLDVWR